MITRVVLGADGARAASGVVVVIDVMRAFTTAAYAFGAGIGEIELVARVEEALAAPGFRMGEVRGRLIPGFDHSTCSVKFVARPASMFGVAHHPGSNPRRELRAIHTAICDAQSRIDHFGFGCFDFKTVENQEHVCCDESNALVSIEKSVILGETESVLRRERREIRVGFICPDVLRTSQDRLEQSGITQTSLAAVLAHLIGVQGLDHGPAKPDWFLHGYFDSSRSALRYLAAVRLYAAMALSKVGS